MIAKACRITEARCFLGEHRPSAKSVREPRPRLANGSRLDAEVTDSVQCDLRQREHDFGGGPQRFD